MTKARYIAKAVGTLRFDPRAGTTARDRWWLIVQCEDDWWELHQHWAARMGRGQWVRDRNGKLQFKNLSLIRPAWGTHISVLRGEKPRKNIDRWREQEGRQVEFMLDPFVHFNDEYWWLNIECPELLDIREFYGLRREPKMRLHLTVGRIAD